MLNCQKISTLGLNKDSSIPFFFCKHCMFFISSCMHKKNNVLHTFSHNHTFKWVIQYQQDDNRSISIYLCAKKDSYQPELKVRCAWRKGKKYFTSLLTQGISRLDRTWNQVKIPFSS